MNEKKLYKDEEKLNFSKELNKYLLLTLYGGTPILGVTTLIFFLFHPVVKVIQAVWVLTVIVFIVSFIQLHRISILNEKTIRESFFDILWNKWRGLIYGLLFFIGIALVITVLVYSYEPDIQYSDLGIIAWGSAFLGYILFICLLMLSGLNLWARIEIVDQNKTVAQRTFDIVTEQAKSVTDINKLIKEFSVEFNSSPNAEYSSVAIQTYLNKWVNKAGYAMRSRALKEAAEECDELKSISSGTLENWEKKWCEFLLKRTEK